MIQCKFCTKPFTPNRYWQKFCTSKCRWESWKSINKIRPETDGIARDLDLYSVEGLLRNKPTD